MSTHMPEVTARDIFSELLSLICTALNTPHLESFGLNNNDAHVLVSTSDAFKSSVSLAVKYYQDTGKNPLTSECIEDFITFVKGREQ